MNAAWEVAAAGARQRVSDSIPQAWRLPPQLAAKASRGILRPKDCETTEAGVLDAKDVEIASIADIGELLQSLKTGHYTAVEVCTAYCKRAAIAHQCLSCLTSFFPEEALDRAAELDRFRHSHGHTAGELHGLPVSLKDSYGIAGKVSSIGLVSWLNNVAKEDSLCAKTIEGAGGILFAKTGTSQACLMVESITNVFGAIRNPHNPELSAGGSSGVFCGLWGLKCSKGRLSGKGMASTYNGSESVNAGLGPMSRSVSGLNSAMRVLLASEPWRQDLNCVPMPWIEDEATKPRRKYRIGLLYDDGVVEPVQPVKRAMDMIVSKLGDAGHELVVLPQAKMMDLHCRGTASAMRSNVQDGGRSIIKHFEASGEPVVPRTAVGSPASLLTSEEIFANHLERANIAADYARIWSDLDLNGLLAPAVAHPAPPRGFYISNSYATMYNLLDYVAGSIPVTVVDNGDVPDRGWLDKTSYPRIEPASFPYDQGDKEMKDLYKSPEVFSNAPVGVQVVCQRLREEKYLGMLKEIEDILR